jgi:hypothetical protein
MVQGAAQWVQGSGANTDCRVLLGQGWRLSRPEGTFADQIRADSVPGLALDVASGLGTGQSVQSIAGRKSRR